MTKESALFALGFWHQIIEVSQPFVIMMFMFAWGLAQCFRFPKNKWIAGLLRLVFYVAIPWLGYQLLPTEKKFNQIWVNSGRPLPDYKRLSPGPAGRTGFKHPELYRQGQGVAWVSLVLLFAGGTGLGLAIFSHYRPQAKDQDVIGDGDNKSTSDQNQPPDADASSGGQSTVPKLSPKKPPSVPYY